LQGFFSAEMKWLSSIMWIQLLHRFKGFHEYSI